MGRMTLAGFRSRVPLTPALRLLEVVDVTDLSPSLRRIRVAGPDAVGFESPGPLDHVKLQVPGADGVLVEPRLGADGALANRAELHLRDMSIRAFDAAAGWLDLDVVRHEGGPLGAWAERAAVGDRVATLGPRGSKRIADVFDEYVFAVDLTALPAASRWAERLRPAARVTLLVCADEADRIEVRGEAALTTRWVTPRADGTTLATALAAHEFAGGEAFVWCGGEAGELAAVRRWARDTGFDGDRLDVSGYWRRGEAGFDHHTEITAD